MMRTNGRKPGQLRDISLTCGVNPHAEGSCLVKMGATEVLCTASLVPGVPRWLKGKGEGWLTAEYGMLPRATHDRKDREATKGKQEGRTVEIQRLIGRSLRSVIDLRQLPDYTMWLDCDVLVADGGTRTAAVTGAWVAMALACHSGLAQRKLRGQAILQPLAAVSVGLGTEGPILDMDYSEDSQILADGNFVMGGDGAWVEVQLSAERRRVQEDELLQMLKLAKGGIEQLMKLQKDILTQATV